MFLLSEKKKRILKGRNFSETKFREFGSFSRKFIPAKYGGSGHLPKFILAKKIVLVNNLITDFTVVVNNDVDIFVNITF